MEIAQAFQWINATMLADSALVAAATGGVWQAYADQGTIAPYALFDHQADTDTLTMNAKRLFNRGLFQIKAVGPTNSFATLVIIADRIDALFGRIGPTGLSSGGILSCYREQGFLYNELVNGVAWSHLGGLYHIDLQGN